jgi:hypothetical protein
MDLNENKISELLAFYLNPNEKHGQGDLFFGLFLDHFSVDWGPFKPKDVIVTLEHPTYTKKRIDILIRKSRSEKAIGIENKIYLNTADQDNQLSDYISFLNNETKGDFILYYLAPKGKKPSNHSISKEDREKFEEDRKLKIINYEEDVIPLLRKFREKIENERLRSFTADFENKLVKWYIGDSMDNKENIKNYILENNRIEASFSIVSALTDLKIDLKNQFQHDLDYLANEMELQKISPFRYKPVFWKNHYIAFNYESYGLLYGIIRTVEDPQKNKIEELENIFSGTIRFKTSQWWPLYDFFYSDVDNNAEFYLDIISGRAIERAREFIATIIDNKDKLPEL